VRRGARDASTYHALGLVRLHAGDVAAAEAAYRDGVRADPNDAGNWLGLATIAVMRKDGALALSAYDAILTRHPKYAAAMLGKAYALVMLGRSNDARHALDEAEEMGAPSANVAKLRAMVEH
jgi:protein O-GlcNAc transferase